jgi:hypothetical protein
MVLPTNTSPELGVVDNCDPHNSQAPISQNENSERCGSEIEQGPVDGQLDKGKGKEKAVESDSDWEEAFTKEFLRFRKLPQTRVRYSEQSSLEGKGETAEGQVPWMVQRWDEEEPTPAEETHVWNLSKADSRKSTGVSRRAPRFFKPKASTREGRGSVKQKRHRKHRKRDEND